MKTVSLLQCFVLTFACALSLSYAECPAWEDLLAEESVVEVRVSRRASIFVGYVNPAQLGVCFLGEDLYEELNEGLLKKLPDRHFFWIGGSHSLDMVDTITRTSMLQGDHEFHFDLATKLSGKRSFPGIETEILVSFEGEIDFTDGVTVFFTGFRGNYSNEYWLPDQYLGE